MKKKKHKDDRMSKNNVALSAHYVKLTKSESLLPVNAHAPRNFMKKSISTPQAKPTKSKMDI